MRVKAENYFLKSFEEMGLLNKHFNVYDEENRLIKENCFINERGYISDKTNCEYWNCTMLILTGEYRYELIREKRKLRDLTKDEWDKWSEKNCYECDNCIFRNVPCTKSSSKKSWFNNKDLYSDKFLNQEIEVE